MLRRQSPWCGARLRATAQRATELPQGPQTPATSEDHHKGHSGSPGLLNSLFSRRASSVPHSPPLPFIFFSRFFSPSWPLWCFTPAGGSPHSGGGRWGGREGGRCGGCGGRCPAPPALPPSRALSRDVADGRSGAGGGAAPAAGQGRAGGTGSGEQAASAPMCPQPPPSMEVMEGPLNLVSERRAATGPGLRGRAGDAGPRRAAVRRCRGGEEPGSAQLPRDRLPVRLGSAKVGCRPCPGSAGLSSGCL